VFDTTSAMQWRRVERDPQLLPSEAPRLLRELDRAVHEALVEVVGDRSHPEPNQGSLTERRLLLTQCSKHQLPASVILGSIDRIGVAQPIVPLQQHHHRQLRWWTGILAPWPITPRQLILEHRFEEFSADLPQEPIEPACRS